VMAGNGTIGLEILDDLPDPDAVVISDGGRDGRGRERDPGAAVGGGHLPAEPATGAALPAVLAAAAALAGRAGDREGGVRSVRREHRHGLARGNAGAGARKEDRQRQMPKLWDVGSRFVELFDAEHRKGSAAFIGIGCGVGPT